MPALPNVQLAIQVDRSSVQAGTPVNVSLLVTNNTGGSMPILAAQINISPAGNGAARGLPLGSPFQSQVPANGSLSLSWSDVFFGSMPANTPNGAGQYTIGATLMMADGNVYVTPAPVSVTVYPLLPPTVPPAAASAIGFPPIPGPGQASFESNLSSGLIGAGVVGL